MAFGQGPIRFGRAVVRSFKLAAGMADEEIQLQASHRIEQRVRHPPGLLISALMLLNTHTPC